MKKMNNKGFSLVELIIVIAIMAILIVVLAPQYLKYVEKSRNSTDLQSATEFKDACEVWAADPEAGEGTTTAFSDNGGTTPEIQVTVTASGMGTATGALKSALDNSGLTESEFKCVSKNNWDSFTITGDIQSNGSIVWTYSNTKNGAADPNNSFAKAMGVTTTSP